MLMMTFCFSICICNRRASHAALLSLCTAAVSTDPSWKEPQGPSWLSGLLSIFCLTPEPYFEEGTGRLHVVFDSFQ